MLATIQPQAKAKDVALSSPRNATTADLRRSSALQGDSVQLAQQRGTEFTPSGGKVWIEPAIRAGISTISVHDTGIGIPVEQQTRIFDKFYQAGMTTKGVREGTGLGLAITKHLVEVMAEHNGREQPGTGQLVSHFTIPLEPGELELCCLASGVANGMITAVD